MNENYDSDENVNEIDNDEIELDDDDLDEDLEDSESMLEPQVNINYKKIFTLFSLGNPSIWHRISEIIGILSMFT